MAAARWLGLLVKAAVSIALLAILLWHIGSAEVLARLGATSLSAVAATIVVLAANTAFIVPRWAEVLRILGAPLPMRLLWRSALAGFFFNQVLPTAVGGDVWRGWQAHRLGAPLRIAAHSVIVDRAVGVVALGLMLAVLLPFAGDLSRQPLAQALMYGALAAVVAAVAVALLLPSAPLIRLPIVSSAQSALADLASAFTTVLLTPPRNLVVIAYSVIGLTLPVIGLAILARSIGIDLPLADVAIVALGSALLATVPLSLGGWGIREGTMVVLFGAYGVPPDAAFGVSILYGASLTLASLPGLAVVFGSRRPDEPAAIR
jgi:glycosyltransferase 2 family protein